MVVDVLVSSLDGVVAREALVLSREQRCGRGLRLEGERHDGGNASFVVACAAAEGRGGNRRVRGQPRHY